MTLALEGLRATIICLARLYCCPSLLGWPLRQPELISDVDGLGFAYLVEPSYRNAIAGFSLYLLFFCVNGYQQGEVIVELTRAIAFNVDLHLLHLRAAFHEHIGDVLFRTVGPLSSSIPTTM